MVAGWMWNIETLSLAQIRLPSGGESIADWMKPARRSLVIDRRAGFEVGDGQFFRKPFLPIDRGGKSLRALRLHAVPVYCRGAVIHMKRTFSRRLPIDRPALRDAAAPASPTH